MLTMETLFDSIVGCKVLITLLNGDLIEGTVDIAHVEHVTVLLQNAANRKFEIPRHVMYHAIAYVDPKN